jgi:hypothetical protein
MPKKVSTTNNNQETLTQTPPPSPNRCQFETSDGRRCRMLRRNHPTLCLFHARDEMQLLESHRLGAELSATLTGQFMTATDINFVLGKLFTATAQNRIPARNAAILAYIGQLMLHSLPRLKSEYPFEYKYESWNKMLDNWIPLSHSWPAPPPAAPVAAPPTTPTTAPAATTPANTSAPVTVPPSTPATAPAPATPAEPSVL